MLLHINPVVKILHLSSISVHEAGVASTSRGLVGDTVFAVLPNVVPWHTFAATVAFQAVRFVLAPYFLINFLSERTEPDCADWNTGFPRQTMASPDVQEFPDGTDTMWLGVVYFRVARPREGDIVGFGTSQVSTYSVAVRPNDR